MIIPVNLDELILKIEKAIRVNHAKLSDLFIVCGAPEEGDFFKELPHDFLNNLKSNLASKDISLLPLVDATRIRVFFSKDSTRMNLNGEFYYAKWILDKRKFNYPNVSKISDRPRRKIGKFEPSIQ